MSRLDLLAAVLAAFSGILGTMTEADWNRGIAIVETEFGSDLDAVALHLRRELAACSLALRAVS